MIKRVRKIFWRRSKASRSFRSRDSTKSCGRCVRKYFGKRVIPKFLEKKRGRKENNGAGTINLHKVFHVDHFNKLTGIVAAVHVVVVALVVVPVRVRLTGQVQFS